MLCVIRMNLMTFDVTGCPGTEPTYVARTRRAARHFFNSGTEFRTGWFWCGVSDDGIFEIGGRLSEVDGETIEAAAA